MTDPTRITRHRIKGWRKPMACIDVTRATIFGNPWQVGWTGLINWPHPDRAGWTTQLAYRDGEEGIAISPSDAVQFYNCWLNGGIPPLPKVLSRKGKKALWSDLDARRGLILSSLPGLRGHSLMCWCAPAEWCHGDTLIHLANCGQVIH